MVVKAKHFVPLGAERMKHIKISSHLISENNENLFIKVKIGENAHI
jgi:hypothetical protein